MRLRNVATPIAPAERAMDEDAEVGFSEDGFADASVIDEALLCHRSSPDGRGITNFLAETRGSPLL